VICYLIRGRKAKGNEPTFVIDDDEPVHSPPLSPQIPQTSSVQKNLSRPTDRHAIDLGAPSENVVAATSMPNYTPPSPDRILQQEGSPFRVKSHIIFRYCCRHSEIQVRAKGLLSQPAPSTTNEGAPDLRTGILEHPSTNPELAEARSLLPAIATSPGIAAQPTNEELWAQVVELRQQVQAINLSSADAPLIHRDVLPSYTSS
jgi:hypothetical protein